MMSKKLFAILVTISIVSGLIGMVLWLECGIWWGLVIAAPIILASAVGVICLTFVIFVLFPLAFFYDGGEQLYDWIQEKRSNKKD